MQSPAKPVPPSPSCDAGALAEFLDGNHRQHLEANRSLYSAMGSLLTEQRVTNALLKDVLAAIRTTRAPMASLHDAVEELTGVHGTDSTPPLLAVGQKTWWKVGAYTLDKAITIVVVAAIMWLWHQATQR